MKNGNNIHNKKQSLKPQRNAPCPCGSGLKYKKCCGGNNKSFNIIPQTKPEIINNHLVSTNGGKTWEKKPGNLCAIIGVIKPEDLDKRVYDLIAKAISSSKNLKNGRLEKKLIDCRHKLQAVKYHLSSIKSEIKERIKEYENNYSPGSGVSLEMENPKLVYETEAFLFQTKSSLDLLTQALGCVVPPLNTMYTFSKKNNYAGGRVIYVLKKNGFNKLGDLLEQHRIQWIQKLVEMRDTVTHYSELKGFHCFIENPYKGEEKVTIHYPAMPSGDKVDAYCQNIYDRLVELYESSLQLVINKGQ